MERVGRGLRIVVASPRCCGSAAQQRRMEQTCGSSFLSSFSRDDVIASFSLSRVVVVVVVISASNTQRERESAGLISISTGVP